MKKVIVAGSLNVDLTIEVDKMPVQGETIHGHDYFVNEGGKGGNQAIAAVKSAADTIFIGSVGKDVFGSFDGGILQPVFSIIAKNSEVNKKEKFRKVVYDTLNDIVKNGIDKKWLS